MISTAPSEIATILERGIVDGSAWPASLSLKDLGILKYVKVRILPGFYTPNVALLANHRKWRSLPPKTQGFLKKKVRDLVTNFTNNLVRKNIEIVNKQSAEAGVETVTLKGEERAKYIQLSQKAGWAEVVARDPVNGPKLRSLITK